MMIKDKLKLYSKGYVKGECRSNEYEARIKREKRLNAKLDLADTMFNELNFPFNTYQKDMVKGLIKEFPNFKELHNKSTNEEIILAMILYVKALETKKLAVSNEFLLTFVEEKKLKQYKKALQIICWKITLNYIQKQPILPTEPEHTDHNILYKG